MRLDQALLARKMTESRTEAKNYIDRGWVEVNGTVVTKNNKSILETDELALKNKRKYVSRGGDKLEGVFSDLYGNKEAIINHLRNKIALDVGSSTGGFTDCLLQNEVKEIDAVDVGTAQIHISLLSNSKVAIFENTDIREFISNKTYDIIVADLSFISLHDTLSTLKKFTHENTKCFLLIKPQFEVGKGNTKKGIVKDENLIKEVLLKIENKCASIGAKNITLFPSHITGGDGNQEYFICFSF